MQLAPDVYRRVALMGAQLVPAGGSAGQVLVKNSDADWDVSWTPISGGGGSYTAGTGLTLTGSAFSITAPVSIALGGTNETTAAAALTSLGAAPKSSPKFTRTATSPGFAVSGLTGATAGGRLVGATASGAPVSGTFSTGDVVRRSGWAHMVCTAGGGPGTVGLHGWGDEGSGRPGTA